MNQASWKRIVGAVALVAALGIPGLMLGKPPKPPAPADQKVTLADLESNQSRGSRQAPITMEVFADFECPQCKIFYLSTAHQLIDNYVNTGKLYMIHRNFPLQMHPYSHDAARWATAAAVVGSRVYDQAEEAIYQHQDEWAATGKIEPILVAALSPADMKKVRTAMMTDQATIDASITRDMNLGQSRRVSGTPTIFVTHAGTTTPLPPGGVSYDLLRQYLDYLLKH